MLDINLYINKKEVKKLLNIRNEKLYKIIDENKWDIIEYDSDLYCLKEDVIKYKKDKEEKKNKYILSGLYIDKKEAKSLLNIGRKGIESIAKDNNWEIVKYEQKIYYLKENVLKYKDTLEQIQKKYIQSGEYLTRNQAKEKLDVPYTTFDNIVKRNKWIVNNILGINYYLKLDIDDYIKKNSINKNINIDNDYISLKEAAKYLNISIKSLYNLRIINNWKVIKKGKVTYILLNNINEYKKKIDDINKKYIYSKDVEKMLGNLTSATITALAKKCKWRSLKHEGKVYYNKLDVNKEVYKKEHDKLYLNLKMSAKYMNMSVATFKEFTNEYNIVNSGRKNYYKYDKKILDEYIKIREEWFKKVISEKELKNRYNLKNIEDILLNQGIYKVKIPLYVKTIALNKLNFYYKDLIKFDELEQKILEKEKLKELNLKKKIEKKQINEQNAKKIKSEKEKLKKERLEKNRVKKQKLKEDKIRSLNVQYNEIKNKGYISKQDAINLLDISNRSFEEFIIEFGIECLVINNKKYFSKKDIEFYKSQQDEIGNRYLTTDMIKQIYGSTNFLRENKIKGFKIPTFCRSKKKVNRCLVLYDREEIEEYFDKRIFREHIYNIQGETDFDTFLLKIKLHIDNIKYFNESIYTQNRWIEYVSDRLLQSKNASNKTKSKMINALVIATINLNDLLFINNVKEVYELTSKQINLWFKSVKDERKRQYIYNFFEIVNEDLKFKLHNIKKINKLFVFKDILKYDDDIFYTNNNVEIDNEIYSYEEYISLFKHLIDVDIHIERSLKDIKSKKINYLSTWLYLILHLNNGWRHGDVTTFPRLYFKDLLDSWNIYSIEWFSRNKLSIAQSRRIISRIIQYDFRISKTEVYGHFFCSDTLAPALSTAILMMESYYQYNHIGSELKYDQPIMFFSNSKYNEPSSSLINKCIKGCNNRQFKFNSRKMNRSVLTFVYNVMCKISPSGYNALILPQYLRAHLDEMSTVSYIEFDKKELEFLSGELFERGEFGYIPDALLNLISDGIHKKEDRTMEIKSINQLFGNIHKLEATVGMLNYFKDEENEITQLLNKMGYEKGVEIISEIYMNNMPSKQLNIQCLFSKEECKNIEIDCIDCMYKIPNIYALRTIGNKLKDEMVLYFNTHRLSKRIKLSARIHCKVNLLMSAIRKYGKEYVYNCMDIDRDEFLKDFNNIDEVDRLKMLI